MHGSWLGALLVLLVGLSYYRGGWLVLRGCFLALVCVGTPVRTECGNVCGSQDLQTLFC